MYADVKVQCSPPPPTINSWTPLIKGILKMGNNAFPQLITHLSQ